MRPASFMVAFSATRKQDITVMPQFSTANAREMAARSHKARLQRLASGNPAGDSSPQTPLTTPQLPAYLAKRLTRVRGQLDLLDKQIDSLLSADVVDYQAVERAARSSASLSELERNLDGRPLPGSRRPVAEAQVKRQFPGPVE